MSRTTRKIIKIDEELCDGCGECVPACAEGALQIIDGKARMLSEKYCDGLGACLGECPQGAISFETREAEEFDEEAAMQHVRETRPGADPHAHHHHHHETQAAACACPSASTIDRTGADEPTEHTQSEGSVPSRLRQWPIKLYLVHPSAPFFEDAHLMVAADCVPFAYGAFHADFLRDKVLVTGCPKFGQTEIYADKLAEIVQSNDIRAITVVRMEVPCCSGIEMLARSAVDASGKDIPVETIVIGLSGEVEDQD